MRHGLAMERPSESFGNDLPRPLPFDPLSPEATLGAAFDDMEEAQLEEEQLPRWYDEPLAALNRYVGFYASQLALWGALLPLIAGEAWRRLRAWRRREGGAAFAHTRLRSPLAPYVAAGWAVPLFLFGILSLRSKVEANWSCMYVVSAAAVLTPWLRGRAVPVRRAILINLGLIFLALVHASTGLLPVRAKKDRILKETHGYNRLADRLGNLEGDVFADSYQLTSMLNFYGGPGLAQQWPGITRDSELIRRREFNRTSIAELEQNGYFWLVTTDRPPPRLPSFAATTLSQLRDCKGGELQEINASAARQVETRCKKAVHEWYLVRYQAIDR
jgi:hypothetical protein